MRIVFSLVWALIQLLIGSNAMADPRAKRKRVLQELGRTSHVSKSGMATLLAEVLTLPDDELPVSFSRSTIARACAEAESIQTSYGALFSTEKVLQKDGEQLDINILNPMPLLEHLIQECHPFERHIQNALDGTPCDAHHPWSIALYSDEAGPGNALKCDNRRMTQVIYWGFIELGRMSDENFWFPLLIARSSSVSMIEGGMSHVMRIALKRFFSDDGHNIATSGMILRFRDGSRSTLFGRFALKVADESALHQTWLHKGANGLLMCLYCTNCVHGKSGLDGQRGYITYTCVDIARFVQHTNATVRGYVRHIAEQRPLLGKTPFESLETQLGFKHSDENLLLDRDLENYVSPIDVTMVDWMHTWIVSGVWNLILGLLMHMLSTYNATRAGARLFTYAHLQAFLMLFTFPRAHEHSRNGTDVCSPKRARSSNKEQTFKCAASEALSVFAIIRLWIEEAVMPLVTDDVQKAACACFILACDVLGLLKRTMRHRHTVTPELLHSKVVDCLRLFLAAFGHAAWIPKCHYALHFGTLLRNFGFLASCFVHERKHKIITRYGDQMNVLEHYERIALREVFLYQRMMLGRLSRFCIVQRTQQPTSKALGVLQCAFPDARAFQIAPEVHLTDFGRVSKGDVVTLRSGIVSQVWLHAVVDQSLWTLVSPFLRIDDRTWTVQRDTEFIKTEDLGEALVYTKDADTVSVILPLGL